MLASQYRLKESHGAKLGEPLPLVESSNVTFVARVSRPEKGAPAPGAPRWRAGVEPWTAVARGAPPR